MTTPELVEYVKKRLAEGAAEQEIRSALRAGGGWTEADLNDAFAQIGAKPSPPSPGAPTPAIQRFQATAAAAGQSGSRRLMLVAAVVLLAVTGSGAIFAYFRNIWPFTQAEYAEGEFLTRMLEKTAGINTAAYSISAAFAINPRDQGATPFTLTVSNAPEQRQKYQNDSERARDVNSILSNLVYSRYSIENAAAYPAKLGELAKASKSAGSYYGNSVSITDPATMKEYEYVLTEGGKNFALKVRFETEDAIREIEDGYGFVATSTIIGSDRRTATFTKDSSPYFYLSPEPPKPFLLEMQEGVRSLPPDINANLSVSASSDFKSENSAWSFNLNAEGDFGDLTYKVNADVLKKVDYYFRVNNIPSIFLGSLASLKGKWIRIPTEVSTSTARDPESDPELNYLSRELPEFEASYKENRENFFDLVRQMVAIADGEKLMRFKSVPKKERKDGRELVRYDLSLRKEAILPFYRKLADVVNGNEKYKEFDSIVDQGTIDYLQSREFSEVFDYIDGNVSFTVWTDLDGAPAHVEINMRIVPPDTALQLADKQANLVFEVAIRGINQPVEIIAPDDAVPIEKVMSDVQKNTFGYDASRLAGIKSNLSNVRAYAELVYDDNNGYGKKKFPAGPCKNTVGTLFGDEKIYGHIKKATNDEPSKATCASDSSNGKLDLYALSVPLPDSPEYSWCIDSYGSSKQIKGAITKAACE